MINHCYFLIGLQCKTTVLGPCCHVTLAIRTMVLDSLRIKGLRNHFFLLYLLACLLSLSGEEETSDCEPFGERNGLPRYIVNHLGKPLGLERQCINLTIGKDSCQQVSAFQQPILKVILSLNQETPQTTVSRPLLVY